MFAIVTAGNPANYQLQIVSLNGFAGTVTFSSCAGEPSASTCTVVPTALSVAANSTSPFQVSITTTPQTLSAPGTTLRAGPPRPASSARLVEAEPLFMVWTAILLLLFLAPPGLAASH